MEDGQHCQAKVVEIRDTPIRPLPKLLAAIIIGSHVVALVTAWPAWNRIVHDRICENSTIGKYWTERIEKSATPPSFSSFLFEEEKAGQRCGNGSASEVLDGVIGKILVNQLFTKKILRIIRNGVSFAVNHV